jgi:dTDP-4-amino-4,6-dideoxygalactose transaminase
MAPLPRYRLYDDPGTYARIGRELLTGRWKGGNACAELEKSLASLGAPHAVLAPRARVAIHLAVKGSIRPGQKVVLSPYTIADVVNMVVAAGGVPVFADIERETCNVDPAEIEKLIDADTGAVLVTHLHGLACDMDVIPRICAERGVALIEDAAQAFGTRFAGRPVGSFGDVGIFSFGKYKNVNAFLGGVLLTRHAELAQRARAELAGWPLQDARHYLGEVLHGLATDVATWPPLFRSFTFWLFRFAFLQELSILNKQVSFDDDPELRHELPEFYRRRMTPLQARLVLRQLSRVDEFTRERIERARVYHHGLRDIEEVLLPPLRTDFSHMYTYFPIQVDDRNALLRHLMRSGRDVAGQHIKNCADFPAFREWHRDCPNARKTAASVVLLPSYPRYAMSDVEANVRVIREYFGAGGRRGEARAR